MTIFVANNLADVVPPDHDSANGRTTSICAVVSPRSREIVLRARIVAHLTAHVPPAPCRGTRAVGVLVRMVAAVMKSGPCFCARRESEKQCHRRNDSTHTVVLLFARDGCYRGVVPVEEAVARARPESIAADSLLASRGRHGYARAHRFG
jgi:hypothetical protein